MRYERLCDFGTQNFHKHNDHVVPHDELSTYAKAYSHFIWDSLSERQQKLFEPRKSLLMAEFHRMALGSTEHVLMNQRGDWAACDACYAKWQEYKKKYPIEKSISS